ncbi:MAG TPA: DUF1249 domain-containing protein [Woeseiaceae bacterium]|nr:DUF1249 domain-containing protein [Woeseiaceae bacterium]
MISTPLDSLLVPETIVRPRSFAGLMSVYESNYLRLLHLVPDLEQIDGCFRSRVAGDCDLHVDIMERSRYTVTLTLTYYFPSLAGPVADPDMLVRAYLDGKQAEAISLGRKHCHVEFRRLLADQSKALGARWNRNVVLNKWLEYLIEQGHLVLDR